MTYRMTSLILGAAMLAAPALAQESAPADPKVVKDQRAAEFDAGDRNKDGLLQKAEWLAVIPKEAKDKAEAVWSSLDPDKTGAVERERYINFIGSPAGIGNPA